MSEQQGKFFRFHLHDRNPGEFGVEGMLATAPKFARLVVRRWGNSEQLYLEPDPRLKFTPQERVTVQYVTVWDEMTFRRKVRLERDMVVQKGDELYVDLTVRSDPIPNP